jgi:hypothetical protein
MKVHHKSISGLTVVVVALTLSWSASQAQFGGPPGPNPALEKLITEAGAQPTPHAADGKPDLSGYWEPPMSQLGGGVFGGKAKTSEDGKTLQLPFPTVGVVNSFDIKNAAARAANTALRPTYKSPESVAKAKFNFDRGDLEDPSYGCKSPGVPRIGMPSEIVQTPNAVYFLYATLNRYRVIPTDGRKHDPSAESMPNGDSIGYWEGDTLVVDTVNLTEDTWLDKDGSFHSKDARVMERFTRKGNTLTVRTTMEDPIFDKPFVMPDASLFGGSSGMLVLGAKNMHVPEDYPCDERSFDNMVSGQKH